MRTHAFYRTLVSLPSFTFLNTIQQVSIAKVTNSVSGGTLSVQDALNSCMHVQCYCFSRVMIVAISLLPLTHSCMFEKAQRVLAQLAYASCQEGLSSEAQFL
jgi:hypothetical protein